MSPEPSHYVGQEGWASSHPSQWRHRAVVTWVWENHKALTASTFCGAAVTAFTPYPFRADIPNACKKCVASLGQPFTVPPSVDELLEAYAINDSFGQENS